MRILILCTVILHLIPLSLFGQEDVVDEVIYNKSAVFLDEGWTHLTGRDYEAALAYFDKSIDLYSGNADAFVGRANALLKLERFQEAESDILAALSMTGEESDMLYLAGNVYFKMKFYEKAQINYTKALAYNEQSKVKIDSAHCYYNRGNTFFEAGMHRSAINDFTKAIQQNEAFKNAYHNRGLSYAHRNMLEEACADFQMAINLGSYATKKYIDKYCTEIE